MEMCEEMCECGHMDCWHGYKWRFFYYIFNKNEPCIYCDCKKFIERIQSHNLESGGKKQ